MKARSAGDFDERRPIRRLPPSDLTIRIGAVPAPFARRRRRRVKHPFYDVITPSSVPHGYGELWWLWIAVFTIAAGRWQPTTDEEALAV